MGMIKEYLLDLESIGKTVEQCEAVEWAIMSGWVPITYRRDVDRATIATQLREITNAYRRRVSQLEEVAA